MPQQGFSEVVGFGGFAGYIAGVHRVRLMTQDLGSPLDKEGVPILELCSREKSSPDQIFHRPASPSLSIKQ